MSDGCSAQILSLQPTCSNKHNGSGNMEWKLHDNHLHNMNLKIMKGLKLPFHSPSVWTYELFYFLQRRVGFSKVPWLIYIPFSYLRWIVLWQTACPRVLHKQEKVQSQLRTAGVSLCHHSGFMGDNSPVIWTENSPSRVSCVFWVWILCLTAVISILCAVDCCAFSPWANALLTLLRVWSREGQTRHTECDVFTVPESYHDPSKLWL